MLTSLYVDGKTWMHRIGAKGKLAFLLVFGLSLYFVHAPTVLLAATIATGFVYFSMGLSLGEALKRIKPVLYTIAFLAAVNAYVVSPLEAFTSTLRLLAVLFLAAAITASTTIDTFMDAITDLLMPLERAGVLKAADVSLAFGLVLRFVPQIFAAYETLKEAHVARGIPVKTHKLIGPLIIATLKDADMIADAIDARGIRGH